MKKGYFLWGFLFIVIFGALLHFTYLWSGNNYIVGAFSAVNESTWEHLKLFYVPFIVFSAFEYFKYGKSICNFFFIKLNSLLLGMLFIVTFFYTYKGVVGFNIDILNIIDFGLAAAISRIYESRANTNNCNKKLNYISLAAIILIGAMFVVFTYYTPQIGIFRDVVKNAYGIPE